MCSQGMFTGGGGSRRDLGTLLPLVHLPKDLHAFRVTKLVAMRGLLPPGQSEGGLSTGHEGQGRGRPSRLEAAHLWRMRFQRCMLR